MRSNRRLGYAFAISLLVNTACVAMVGTAALRRPSPLRGHDTSALHPAPLQMADASQARPGEDGTLGRRGDGSAGSEGGIGAGDGPTAGAGQGRPGGRDGKSRSASGDGASDKGGGERQRAAAQKSAGGKWRMAPAGSVLEENAARSEEARETDTTRREAVVEAQRLSTLSHASEHSPDAPRRAPKGTNRSDARGQGRPPRTGMAVVRRPTVPGRNGRAGDPGDSISPKMVKYPRRTLDLGTIHMTRPTHGVTGGGSADLRDVAIKVHYVVDDPNNVPKTLQPDKIVRLFPTNCNGDPGNTSKCLPTGGNTRLGGTVLHGRHDQITGVKYCVPGGGGIPSGGASGSQSAASRQAGWTGKQAGGKQAASGRIVSEVYHGRSPASSETAGGGKAGPLNPSEQNARVINALHLPAAHGRFPGLVPGAEVPEADRRWVPDPMAHAESAPPGPLTTPMPRFTVAPRSIGSLSRFGSIDWGRPMKTRRKKAPHGGDGSGLLGMYYHGNGFNQLAFTRPDRNIDYDWSAGPPDARITPGTEYSVRWLGEVVPRVTDAYTLMLASDDGARLYLDGRLLIANWTVHSPSEDTATIRLEAGRHYAIKLEYYENSVPPAVMKLYWEAPSVPREYIPEQCLRYPKTRP